MNQARVETPTPSSVPKPHFDDSYRQKPEMSRRGETTPIGAGIYVSNSTLTEQIKNEARAEAGETAAQLALKTWLAQLLREGHLPYLGKETMGALFFRVDHIDKTAGIVRAAPTLMQTLLGQEGAASIQKTSVVGGDWQTNDIFIALRLPLAETSMENRVGLIQGGIFKRKEGEAFVNMLSHGPHTQNVTELINLLLGLNSFGLGGKDTLKNTGLIELPGKFEHKSLPHISELQILPNYNYKGTITSLPKKQYLIPIANF